MSRTAHEGVLLVGHGTVSSLAALPDFLREIRRGREPPDALITEMVRRYELIGGSPLLRISHEQAESLAKQVQLPVLIGMRFGECRIADALERAARAGIRRLVVVPMAPFSVGLYVNETQRVLKKLQAAGHGRDLELCAVSDWGESPQLIDAFRESVLTKINERGLNDAPIVCTAHSLPNHVISQGDTYEIQVQASVNALRSALGRELILAFQSQGEGGGAWLGPSLRERIEQLAESGAREIIVVPIGFLSEHVETLYDLDHEASDQAERVGIKMIRVQALNTHPGLILCLRDMVCAALGRSSTVGRFE
jgi:protoporphyrin/coproporphyrin ferrochelatase